ncbi:MAG: hypothetical protein KF830_17425 [Planctomycetes bacterium]|nr:hypothetical protein [Planctomycetota bacterium]
MKPHRLLAIASLASCLSAQTVETLLLPDVLDLRPTATRLQDRIDDLVAEAALQAGLGASTLAQTIQGLVADLQAALAGGPLPAPATVEVHVVSFYEGAGAASTASVALDRPGAPVILLLNAYEAIDWTVTATPATGLLAVLSYAYEAQTVAAPAGVLQLGLSYAGNGFGDYWGQPDDPTDPAARFRAARWCVEKLGLPLTTFTGGYAAPAATFTAGPGNLEWRRQVVLDAAARAGEVYTVATRQALAAAFQGDLFLPLLVPATGAPGVPTVAIANPIELLAPLLPLPDVRAYAIDGGGNVFTLRLGQPSRLLLPSLTFQPLPPYPTLPPFAPLSGMTYDAIGDRLLVCGFGGAGALYAWSPASGLWSLLATLADEEPAAIAWHPLHDATFGVRIDPYAANPLELRRYDATGSLVQVLPIGLPTFGEIWDAPQLHALGSNLVFVGAGIPVLGRTIRHCFVIDPLTGDVLHAGVLLG